MASSRTPISYATCSSGVRHQSVSEYVCTAGRHQSAPPDAAITDRLYTLATDNASVARGRCLWWPPPYRDDRPPHLSFAAAAPPPLLLLPRLLSPSPQLLLTLLPASTAAAATATAAAAAATDAVHRRRSSDRHQSEPTADISGCPTEPTDGAVTSH